jgi:hypothetical protein
MNTAPTMPTADDRGRALLVIDLENALGCDPDHVADWAWSIAAAEVLAAAGASPGDLVVVAVSPRRAFQARAALPGALLRCRRGVDGADLALIDELADIDWIADRFDRVVIASGDHIFAHHAARIAAAGIRVDHVAHSGRCSASLRLAVHHTHWLPNHQWAYGSDAA